jgi:hypothetical protein
MNKILIAIAMLLVITLASEVIDTNSKGTNQAVELGARTVAAPLAAARAVPVISTPSWRDDWAVRSGPRGAHDWNNDGVIDWRDDRLNFGATPWAGDYVRADWNRDGVVDWQDGWRKLDNTWASGSWDPTWRGEGWRPESVSVREVPSGNYADTEWRNVDGPWDTQGWGGQSYGVPVQSYGVDWNRDGVVDWRDGGAFTTGNRVQGLGVYDDFRTSGYGGLGYGVGSRVGGVSSGRVSSALRPGVQRVGY